MTGRTDDEAAVAPGVAERVHRIEFAIDWPPGHAAAYLVGGDEPTLVDSGAPGDRGRAELVEGLADAGYEPGDVEHVLVTHPHSDHVGQVPTVLEAGDGGDASTPAASAPTVYAPAGVPERLRRDADDLAASVREHALAAGLTGDRVDEAVENAVDSLERDRRLLPPERIDRVVAGGDRFEAGDLAVEAVHAPGHQAEHLCYQVAAPEGDLLFSGDMVVEPFRAAALHVGLDDGCYEAVDAFYTAYDRLAGRDVAEVCPGHGPVFGDYAGAVERSRADVAEMVEDAADALAGVAPASPAAVAAERADGESHTAILLDTVGALGHLDVTGRATHEVVDGVRQYRPVG